MASPLQGAIAATIGKAFAKTFYDATLVRTAPASPSGGPSWDLSGTPTETEHACLGMVDTYSDYAKANSLVDAKDVKVLVLATSLSVVPNDRDRVTIRGATYKIMEVATDPARAVWELKCRL